MLFFFFVYYIDWMRELYILILVCLTVVGTKRFDRFVHFNLAQTLSLGQVCQWLKPLKPFQIGGQFKFVKNNSLLFCK